MASTYYCLHTHVVFSTRQRVPLIGQDWMGDLHAYLGGIARNLGAMPLAVGGISDHVHMLVGLKTTHSVAEVVREVKKSSSIWAEERQRGFRWQEGYGVFSVSVEHLPELRSYIANQAEHHKKLSSADELRQILKACGMEIDERYFE